MTQSDTWLTPAEFAAKVRVPEGTVRGLCRRGLLPGAYQVGSRWRIDFAEFKVGAKVKPPLKVGRAALPVDLLARVYESVA